eukprot:GHVP01015688.1.p1 GENE.GHVP01015688.1~~GHVP01015688.1.p1  ORF type:complete len:661 (+),score=131.09 GHVP01015688.1:220-2202(+)
MLVSVRCRKDLYGSPDFDICKTSMFSSDFEIIQITKGHCFALSSHSHCEKIPPGVISIPENVVNQLKLENEEFVSIKKIVDFPDAQSVYLKVLMPERISPELRSGLHYSLCKRLADSTVWKEIDLDVLVDDVRSKSLFQAGRVVKSTQIEIEYCTSEGELSMIGQASLLETITKIFFRSRDGMRSKGVNYFRKLSSPFAVVEGPIGSGKTLFFQTLIQLFSDMPDPVVKTVKSCSELLAFIRSYPRNPNLSSNRTVLLFDDFAKALTSKPQTSDLIRAVKNLQGVGMIAFATTGEKYAEEVFDFVFHISLPTVTERERILKQFCQEICEIPFHVAQKSHAFNPGDLRRLCLAAGVGTAVEPNFDEAFTLVTPFGLADVAVDVPNVRWTDIGGYDNEKEKLREVIEWPLQHSEIFSSIHIRPPKGVLLYGPPGCGKTLMAKAVASEKAMNFISVKGPEIFKKWVGESERSLRRLFEKARQHQPCVLFIDEIDAIAPSRQKERSLSGVENRVLSQLLTELDGISSSQSTVIIGATNRPQDLDPAILRPGRFDRLVYIGLPCKISRKILARIALGSIRMEVRNDGPSPEDYLADRTVGCSGAEVTMVVKEAVMNSLRRRIKNKISNEEFFVQWKDLEEAALGFSSRLPKDLEKMYKDFQNTHY